MRTEWTPEQVAGTEEERVEAEIAQKLAGYTTRQQDLYGHMIARAIHDKHAARRRVAVEDGEPIGDEVETVEAVERRDRYYPSPTN